MLFQAAKSVGLSDRAASLTELGINLAPSIPTVTREAGNLAKKGMINLLI